MKRKLIEDFLIDGKPMLCPDNGVILEENDLISNDCGRDEAGFMHRIVIRKGIKTWRFIYSVLTAEEYVYVKSLLQNKADFVFTFKDDEGTIQQTRAYSTQTSVSYWSARRGLYKDFEFEINEC